MFTIVAHTDIGDVLVTDGINANVVAATLFFGTNNAFVDGFGVPTAPLTVNAKFAVPSDPPVLLQVTVTNTVSPTYASTGHVIDIISITAGVFLIVIVAHF